MELLSYTLQIPKRDRDQPFVLAPIGDIQWAGKDGPTAQDTLRRHVARLVDLNAWALGCGDYIDFMSPSNRARLRSADLYDCVTEDVRILTRTGWKYHHELLIGEDVLGYCLETRAAVWTPVKRIAVWDDAPITNLSGRGLNWLTTPNHKWVEETFKGVQQFIRTDGLYRGRHKVVIAAALREDGKSGITDDEATLLGWILSDGHVKFPQCWTTYISQSKQEQISEIRELLSRLDGYYVAEAEKACTGFGKPGRTWMRWGLSAPQIRALFSRVGVTQDSDIPGIASRLSVSARESMLLAMLRAEGHREHSGDGWQFSQLPGPRLDLFMALCALLGIPTRRGKADQYGVIRTGTRTNRLRWITGSDAAARRGVGVDRRKVWCPVTDTHTWMACYEYQTAFTGNTAEDVISDKASELTHEVYNEFLAPLNGKFAGLVEGHHFTVLRNGKTTDQLLAGLLATRFLGSCALVRLSFREDAKRATSNGYDVTLLVHHGQGGGSTVGAALNKLERWSMGFGGVDLVIMGHTTKMSTAPVSRIYPVWSAKGELDHRSVRLVNAGGFSRSYVPGQMMGRTPRGLYPEVGMMAPAALGAPLIHVRPRLEGRKWIKEITVEV